MRSILTIVVLLSLSASADAGPIRDRLRARFGGCQSCQQSPQAAFPAEAPVAANPAVTTPVAYTLPAATTCANGSCAAAPVTVRRGLFR